MSSHLVELEHGGAEMLFWEDADDTNDAGLYSVAPNAQHDSASCESRWVREFLQWCGLRSCDCEPTSRSHATEATRRGVAVQDYRRFWYDTTTREFLAVAASSRVTFSSGGTL